MRTLAISTSQARCGVAWSNGNQFEWHEFSSHNTGEQLRELIAPFIAKGFDRIGVDIGPGSYTGTRVGVAFAQGLATAKSIPWSGITVWQILAAISPAGALLVAASRSGEVLVHHVNDRIEIHPLCELTEPVFGFPCLDPLKYGADEQIQCSVPDFEQYLRALVKIVSETEHSQTLPQYYDQYSRKDPAI